MRFNHGRDNNAVSAVCGSCVIVWLVEASRGIVFIPVSAADGLLERRSSPVEHLRFKGCLVFSAIHNPQIQKSLRETFLKQ